MVMTIKNTYINNSLKGKRGLGKKTIKNKTFYRLKQK